MQILLEWTCTVLSPIGDLVQKSRLLKGSVGVYTFDMKC